MPTIPWTSPRRAGSQAGAVLAMASEFELTSLRHVPRFFLDAMRIYRQTLAADGAVGISLEARLLSGRFRTLSTWRDRPAVNEFVRTEPHRSSMRRHHPHMRTAKFVFWESESPRLSWDEATQRLAETPPQ
jgi:hypothetical protein